MLAVIKVEANRCDPTGGKRTVYKEIVNAVSLFYFIKQYETGYRSFLNTLAHIRTVQSFVNFFVCDENLWRASILHFHFYSSQSMWAVANTLPQKHNLKCSNPLLSWQNFYFSILHEISFLYASIHLLMQYNPSLVQLKTQEVHHNRALCASPAVLKTSSLSFICPNSSPIEDLIRTNRWPSNF